MDNILYYLYCSGFVLKALNLKGKFIVELFVHWEGILYSPFYIVTRIYYLIVALLFCFVHFFFKFFGSTWVADSLLTVLS